MWRQTGGSPGQDNWLSAWKDNCNFYCPPPPPQPETLFFCLSFSLELKSHPDSTLSTMQWLLTAHTVRQFFWAAKESLLRLLIWLFLISCAAVLFKIRFYIVNWANGSIFNKNIKHFSVYFTLRCDYFLSRSPQEKVLLGKRPLIILGWAPHYPTKPYSLNFQLHKDSSYNAKAQATQGPEQRAG